MTRRFLSSIAIPALCLGFVTTLPAAEAPPQQAPNAAKEVSSSRLGDFLASLLPIALQKRPAVVFNAITEMTPEGKKRRVPTPQEPIYYYSPPAQFVQRGERSGGEQPPPTASLEAAMRKELATNGYLPITDDRQRPDLVIVFDFGSHGSVFDGIDSASEVVGTVVRSPYLLQDVLERAQFVGGEKFAFDMFTALKGEAVFGNMPGNAPFQMFMKSYDSDLVDHFVEIAFHSFFYVRATAFDFSGIERKEKVPLWQSRMSVEAQGVSMEEILKPLIVSTGSFLGRETPEPRWFTKRVDREGTVQIGEATVVPDKDAVTTGAKKVRRGAAQGVSS